MSAPTASSIAEVLDGPVREEVRAGLDRVAPLVPGTGFLDFNAGVDRTWQGQLGAFAELDVGFKPVENVDLFGFARADLAGASAGIGARVRF